MDPTLPLLPPEDAPEGGGGKHFPPPSRVTPKDL